jgi:hypothetical protein
VKEGKRPAGRLSHLARRESPIHQAEITMPKKAKLSKAERLNRSIERWERKQEAAVIMLRKSAEELLKLRRQRKRSLERETAKAIAERAPAPAAALPAAHLTVDGESTPRTGTGDGIAAELPHPLDIPEILDRNRKLQAMADPKTKEKKAQRKEVEKQKREAELTGKRRKLPLSGKDALRAIGESK